MVKFTRIAIAFVILIMLVACSKPSMRYSPAKPEKITSLKEGEMVFRLRSTNITVMSRSASEAKNPIEALKPTDVCKAKVNSADSATRQDISAIHKATNRNNTPFDALDTLTVDVTTPPDVVCLADVFIKTTPISDDDYYMAVPGDLNPWARTGLSAETIDGDDFFITTVTVSFNDQTKQAIARAGTGALAGLSIAGPYGAIGGAIIGLVASLPDKGIQVETPPRESFTNRICKTDEVTEGNVNKPGSTSTKLMLPVTIDLRKALKENNGAKDGCWHPLPDNPSFTREQGQDKKGNGWFYRIVLEDKPFGAQSTSEYFTKANSEAPRHDFPITPCQDAKLHLVWWGVMQNAMPLLNIDDDLKKDTQIRYLSFPIKVANPDFVRVIPLPRAGNIKLGTVCGGHVTYSPYSGPTTGDDFDALITAVKNIKTAQDEYNKNK